VGEFTGITIIAYLSMLGMGQFEVSAERGGARRS
jgi:hypothetical protein